MGGHKGWKRQSREYGRSSTIVVTPTAILTTWIEGAKQHGSSQPHRPAKSKWPSIFTRDRSIWIWLLFRSFKVFFERKFLFVNIFPHLSGKDVRIFVQSLNFHRSIFWVKPMNHRLWSYLFSLSSDTGEAEINSTAFVISISDSKSHFCIKSCLAFGFNNTTAWTTACTTIQRSC